MHQPQQQQHQCQQQAIRPTYGVDGKPKVLGAASSSESGRRVLAGPISDDDDDAGDALPLVLLQLPCGLRYSLGRRRSAVGIPKISDCQHV